MKNMKKTNFIVAFLCVALVALAQESKLSNYSRLFLTAQKEATTPEQRAKLRKNFVLKVAENEQEYVSAFVHFYSDAADKSLLEAYGVLINSDFGDFVTAQIPVEKLEALSQDENIKRVEIAKPIQKKMDKARPAANVDKVQAGTGLSQPFLGAGVVVGVVDGGFHYNHINFYNANNTSELRVKRVLRQANSGRASSYRTKKEYTTQAEIETAKYDDTNDETGHATHVTGIAAGSYSSNDYHGVAKEADIVMVSMGSGDTDIADGVKYVFDYATEVGKPAVVNLSLGTHFGPHDGTSTFDRTLDAMVGAGRIVCGAAGNEGEDKLYIEKELKAGESTVFFLNLSTIDIAFAGGMYGAVDIWGDNDQKYTVQAVFADYDSDEIKWSGTEMKTDETAEKEEKNFSSYGAGGLVVYTEKSPESQNQRGNATYGFSLNESDDYFLPEDDYKFGIKITAQTAGTVRAWTNGYSGVLGWENGQNHHSVGEIGGTANGIISVGAWTSKVDTYDYLGEKEYYSAGTKVGPIAPFSSMGPTADGRLKPEITAPGDVVMSSLPNTSKVKKNALNPQTAKVNGVEYYWGYESGTSMATPFVTGVVATWLQANPQLTPEQIKSVFAQTSIADSNTGSSLPNNTWGYGKIDAYAGLQYVIKTVDVKHLEGLPEAIMLYPNPSDGAFQLFFTQNDNAVNVRVYAANGQQVYARHIGSVSTQQTIDIDLGNVQAGAYIVKIAGNGFDQTCRLMVK